MKIEHHFETSIASDTLLPAFCKTTWPVPCTNGWILGTNSHFDRAPSAQEDLHSRGYGCNPTRSAKVGDLLALQVNFHNVFKSQKSGELSHHVRTMTTFKTIESQLWREFLFGIKPFFGKCDTQSENECTSGKPQEYCAKDSRCGNCTTRIPSFSHEKTDIRMISDKPLLGIPCFTFDRFQMMTILIRAKSWCLISGTFFWARYYFPMICHKVSS